MSVFKFRIQVDDQDDFLREVEIKSNQTFYQLHDFMVKNLKLGGKELASFHVAGERWEKLQEITLIDMSGEEDKNVKASDDTRTIFLMDQTPIERFIKEIDQKLIYEYDFLQMRTFLLELVDITHEDRRVKYPRLTFSRGKIQLEDNVRVEKDSEKLKEYLLKEFNSIIKGDFEDDFDSDDDDY